jgi:hypothetical protein
MALIIAGETMQATDHFDPAALAYRICFLT